MSLSVADVFRWLEAEGLFPRSSSAKPLDGPKSARKQTATDPLNPSADPCAFCCTCGVQRAHHPSHPPEDPRGDLPPLLPHGPGPGPACASFQETFAADADALAPVIDVDAALAKCGAHASAPGAVGPRGQLLCAAVFAPRPRPEPASPSATAAVAVVATDAASAADPRLVAAVCRITGLPFLQRAGGARLALARGPGSEDRHETIDATPCGAGDHHRRHLGKGGEGV